MQRVSQELRQMVASSLVLLPSRFVSKVRQKMVSCGGDGGGTSAIGRKQLIIIGLLRKNHLYYASGGAFCGR